ncbi:MAG TPA: hypothetical protein DD490_33410 [Acidobacteria bacterium]|nr:hypothetical protein [Acidobacteriota bacterium]
MQTSSSRQAEPVLKAGLLSAFALWVVFAASLLGAPGAPEQEVATAPWALLEAVTTVSLDTTTLSGLGLQVSGHEGSVRGHALHPLSVVPAGTPSFAAMGQIDLRAAVGADGFHGFEGGALRHRGGFLLRGPAGTFDLSTLELRVGAKATVLELVDATGEAVLTTEYAQWELDKATGALRYLNADLRPTLALARKLGDERYTTVTVGILDLDATLQIGDIPPGPAIVGETPPPCGDWSGNVDVGLVNMSSFAQAGVATVNGRSVVVVLPSAELENVGTANVPWYSKFTNLGNPPWNDQHPFLVWQMARVSGGVFEPLGRSDLKHAFLTINSGCAPGACTDSHVLGISCADVYGTGTNNSVGSLAPRSEVTASTGIWSHCGGIPSHFDTNGDCVQDFSGSGENAFTHGLKAAEADLQVAGATYYVEAFYIVRNDINIFNSMGHRQVAPAKPAATWTFPTAGAYTQGPAINSWVNPTTPGAGADNRTLDTGEGRVQLAVKVTTLAGSPTRHRYAYALQNHDFDRRIKSFRVPFNTAIGVVENIAFADGDGFAANDWVGVPDATGITWTAPAAATPPAELDYASVISFRFDSDQTSAAALASLGVFEAGAPTQLNLQTLAPATGAVTPGDYHTVTPCRLLDTRTVGDGATPITSGTVRELNVLGVTACGIPAEATAVAINVTAINPGDSGYLVVYSSTDPPTASTLTFGAGAVRTNNAISKLTVDGKLKIRPVLTTGGSVHVAIDVAGYFAPGTP